MGSDNEKGKIELIINALGTDKAKLETESKISSLKPSSRVFVYLESCKFMLNQFSLFARKPDHAIHQRLPPHR